jgi:hypothetical protein
MLGTTQPIRAVITGQILTTRPPTDAPRDGQMTVNDLGEALPAASEGL